MPGAVGGAGQRGVRGEHSADGRNSTVVIRRCNVSGSRLMKISFTSLRTKAVLAVTLIVASVLGGTGLTYFAVRQQRAALNDVHAAADTVVGPSIALIRA